MKRNSLLTCLICLCAVTSSAQNGVFSGSLMVDSLPVQSNALKPLGLTLVSQTPTTNNPAVGMFGLHRKTYISSAGSGNDFNDGVGLWIKGYYQGVGDALPIFLGGAGFNNQDSKMMIGSNGNIGIGTTAPLERLHVNGRLYLNSVDWVNGWARSYLHWAGHSLVMGSRPGHYAHNILELKPGGASNGNIISALQLFSALDVNEHELKIQFRSEGISFINGGNVGIGTTTPQARLAVNGDIFAKKVKVTQTGWPDYVFKPDYQLPTLQELAAFIKKNQRLPDIPSAKDVEKDGVDLGEINKQLLKKIEELTLYILEQDDKYTNLQKRIKLLEERIDAGK